MNKKENFGLLEDAIFMVDGDRVGDGDRGRALGIKLLELFESSSQPGPLILIQRQLQLTFFHLLSISQSLGFWEQTRGGGKLKT